MQDFSSFIEPSSVALISWWFGTGIILLLVRLPKEQFSPARLIWTLISIPALYFTYQSMLENTNANAYMGFISTIVLWGWHELAFLTGWISGPRRVPLEPGLGLWDRFKQSVQVVWHHELALFVTLILLVIVQIGHPNHTAMCTFALLWLMRLSSKLNLFFGVPQVGEQYLPTHLTYMGSYFRKKPVGVFFYCTMGLSIAAWLYLIWQAHEGLVTITSHWVLLASLLGLAIIEHMIMMIPLSLERVWGWALKGDASSVQTVSNALNQTDLSLLNSPHRSASTPSRPLSPLRPLQISLPSKVFEDPLITPMTSPGLVVGSAMDTK